MPLWTPASSPPNSATWAPPSSQSESQPQQQSSSADTVARGLATGRASMSSPAPPSHKIKYQGKRIAQIVKLKPESYSDYKKCHAKVWPEVLKQIKSCNIEDYSIFYDDLSHTLFASFKYMGYDYAGDMEKMRENDKVREWWKMTDAYQVSLVKGAKSSEAGEPSWWKGLEEVFYYA